MVFYDTVREDFHHFQKRVKIVPPGYVPIQEILPETTAEHCINKTLSLIPKLRPFFYKIGEKFTPGINKFLEEAAPYNGCETLKICQFEKKTPLKELMFIAETLAWVHNKATKISDPMGEKPVDYFRIEVKSLVGKKISVLVNRRFTLQEVKYTIQDQEGIPPDQQRLIWRGMDLASEATLGYYKIKAGETLHLVLRLRGGMFHVTSGSGINIKSVIIGYMDNLPRGPSEFGIYEGTSDEEIIRTYHKTLIGRGYIFLPIGLKVHRRTMGKYHEAFIMRK